MLCQLEGILIQAAPSGAEASICAASLAGEAADAPDKKDRRPFKGTTVFPA